MLLPSFKFDQQSETEMILDKLVNISPHEQCLIIKLYLKIEMIILL